MTLISHSKKVIVLAHRGTTQSKQLFDQFITTVRSKIPSGFGGNVHRYFSNVHGELKSCTASSIKALISKYPQYNVLVTGHSLGGALASLASGTLLHGGYVESDKMELFTFGMPKVGDSQYAAAHNNLVKKSWRIVHRNDVVPKIPLKFFGYMNHNTKVFYPNENMSPQDTNFVVSNPDESSKWSLNIWSHSVADHKRYFNIDVGSHCNTILGRKKRSAEEHSDMWDKLRSDKCSVITFKPPKGEDTGASAKGSGTVHGLQIMLLLASAEITLLKGL